MTTPGQTNSRPTLSVAIIVRDVADILPDTLDSIREVADEIVVLDTGSSDATIHVARDSGAKVSRTKWEDDFAQARNMCLEKVTGDWILWLDAGETIHPEFTQQLRNFIDRDADPRKAYMMFVQLPSSAKQLAGEQIGQVRLVPRRANLTFTGRIRESMLPQIIQTGLEVDALQCIIQRHASDAQKQVKVAKAQRNMKIVELARAKGETAQETILLMVEAESLYTLGKREEAISCYRRAIATAERGTSVMLEAYYGLLTAYDGHPEDKETQIETCLEALDAFPLDAQLLCGMGSYLLNQQRLDLAARSYEIATTHGQVDPTTWHIADIVEIAATCLSLTYLLKGETEQAIQVLRKTLELYPNSVRIQRQLLDVLIKQKRREETLALMDQLSTQFPNLEQTRSACRGALLAAEENYSAAEPYLKSAFSAGCRERVCLRWLVTTYLALGQSESATAVMAAWEQTDPSDPEIAAFERFIVQTEPKRPSTTGIRIDMQKSAPTGKAMPIVTGMTAADFSPVAQK